MRRAVFIDRFSVGLDELTRKQQGSLACVLRVLDSHGEFSVFEATESQVIAKTIEHLQSEDYMDVTPKGFPWLSVTVTEKGRKLIGGET